MTVRPLVRRWCGLPALLFLSACSRGAAPSGGAKPAAQVENRQAEAALATVELSADAERRLGIATQPIARREVARERRYAAEVVVPPGRALTLCTPFAATVRCGAPAPRVGAVVAAGAPLLTLEPQPSPDRQVLSAAERTSVARARADLELVKSQLEAEVGALTVELDADRIAAERAAALLDAGSGSQRGRDEARARVALTERKLATTEQRHAALAEVVLDVEESAPPQPAVITSPWSATITALHVADGQAVAPGGALVALADLSELWLRVELPAGDAGEIQVGSAAQVRPLGGRDDAAVLRATPVVATPRGDFARATVERFFGIEPRDGAGIPFQPGERVTIALPLATRGERLVVAASALVRDVHGGVWVYVRRGERRYARARVELDRVDGELALLARGPAEGSEVVIAGVAELYGTEFGAGK